MNHQSNDLGIPPTESIHPTVGISLSNWSKVEIDFVGISLLASNLT
jgi:hypothetical protein